MSTDDALISRGRQVLEVEASALSALVPRLDGDFARACHLISEASGRVVTCGIGKSGHVARKIAATLTSTGTPAIFLHPVEALHGDIGIIGSTDVALVVTKSGSLTELEGMLAYLVRKGVPIIALVGSRSSPIAAHARVTLDCSVAEEACPMDLAPTASTTAALAMGDALAVGVLSLRGFDEEDFAALHPGGALGRKLSVLVSDVMIAENYPTLPPDATLRTAIAPLAHMRGTVPIVGPDGELEGVLTAGDLTRAMDRNPDFLDLEVRSVMTRDPHVARKSELGSAAASRMEANGIMALPVLDERDRLAGLVHLHDLMKSGAI